MYIHYVKHTSTPGPFTWSLKNNLSIQDYGTGGNGPVTSPPSYVYVPCGESEPEAERLSINDLQTHQVLCSVHGGEKYCKHSLYPIVFVLDHEQYCFPRTLTTATITVCLCTTDYD